jgi:hypothetical protein
VPLRPPQIPHGLTEARTRASAVRRARDAVLKRNHAEIVMVNHNHRAPREVAFTGSVHCRIYLANILPIRSNNTKVTSVCSVRLLLIISFLLPNSAWASHVTSFTSVCSGESLSFRDYVCPYCPYCPSWGRCLYDTPRRGLVIAMTGQTCERYTSKWRRPHCVQRCLPIITLDCKRQ